MFTSFVHDHGFRTVFFESRVTKHGPVSPRAAGDDGAPGPPWSHSESGALSGFLRASKNQKKV